MDTPIAGTEALVRDTSGDRVARRMQVIQRNRTILRRFIILALAMFGVGYLLPPLYSTVCRITGFNRLQSADAVSAETQADAGRIVLMQFDSNLRDDLPWAFRPVEAAAQIHPGQLVRVSYEVRNNSDRVISGQAIASYAPMGAAAYVRKLECFCFSIQTLAPHEVRIMPVVFLIDRSLPNDVPSVTLSYTFFEVPGRRPPSNERGS
jgi:cytochrome c oxidase assembly protein subunit 11